MEKNKVNLEVREITIEEAFEVHKRVLEFNEMSGIDEFINRYARKKHVIIGAFLDNKLIGYIIAYDKHEDGERIYIWMAGVDNNYRRLGALKKMMDYINNWAKENSYTILAIKTRNNRREMINFLSRNDFNFITVEQRDDVRENRIELEKFVV